MLRYDRRTRRLAAILAGAAGFVDAMGFIAMNGFFVSFMSGNSTRLGVGLTSNWAWAAVAGGLIGAFLAGVVAGSVIGRLAGPGRRRVYVLCLVSLLLLAAPVASGLGWSPVALALMAAAMGAENAVFEREGEVSIGLTYMTGTLVKLGQRLADGMMGGDPKAATPYLAHWLGLVGGAVAGAALYPHSGLHGVWLAALVVLACAIWDAMADRS